jgi:thymidylate kinase
VREKQRRPVVVSFSGIDGAGKSTQIQALASWLRGAGLTVSIFSMWDDVVVASRFREFTSRCVFGGDQGIGSPERPLHRRDKNVTSWPLELFRFGLYFADALRLSMRIRQMRNGQDSDVIIFDRYIYDELANLRLNRKFPRAFARLIVKVVPEPELSYIIDADPQAARLRKPEYPLEFLCRNRESYRALSALARNMILVGNAAIEEIAEKIREQVLGIISTPGSPATSSSVAMLP